ncbi:MAG TPA: TusE/DsrC/DsvC family sulfur relay protein [Gammaproteobacteria bacterium]|nr:TusE/DsrC/DsvC family sulfur relay protein [Gammaproteobacteria bacterium]
MAEHNMYEVVEAHSTGDSGFLSELGDWTEAKAIKMAKEDGLKLTDEHLEILHYLRKYYDKNGQGYNARTMLGAMEFEFGKWEGKRRLYQLFPHGPVSMGCKYAGIPLPPECNDKSFGSVH